MSTHTLEYLLPTFSGSFPCIDEFWIVCVCVCVCVCVVCVCVCLCVCACVWFCFTLIVQPSLAGIVFQLSSPSLRTFWQLFHFRRFRIVVLCFSFCFHHGLSLC